MPAWTRNDLRWLRLREWLLMPADTIYRVLMWAIPGVVLAATGIVFVVWRMGR